MTVAWVVGGRGLLGSAVLRSLGFAPGWKSLDAAPLPWDRPDELSSAAAETVAHLIERATELGEPWTIIWVGGSGVTSTPGWLLDDELDQLRNVLDGVATRARALDAGSIFYASSAGGVYAGSAGPPFDERTAPVPISPYGMFKLRAEQAVREFAERNGIPSLIGRISNLYGPGQRLEKMQGLISQVARAQFSPAPASIYVSLDTVRDYLYVDDCAALILDALARLERGGRDQHVMKIFASGQAATIGGVLGQFRQLTKHRPHIMVGQSSDAGLQAPDLRVRSVVWPELDRRPFTPFAVGIDRTIRAVFDELVRV